VVVQVRAYRKDSSESFPQDLIVNYGKRYAHGMSKAERATRNQLRAAMDDHLRTGGTYESWTWRRIIELDAKLQAIRGQ
jgi:hypothetical protein